MLPLLAVWITYRVSPFTRIPWTLSFLSVALVASIGGMAPALIATLIASCGLYVLVLASASSHFCNPNGLIQTAAFVVVAVYIAYLVRQRNLAASSLPITRSSAALSTA